MERRWTVRSGEDVGRAIGEICRARDLTQAQLATQSGLSRTWLAKMETGRSALVLEHMLRVLRRLGATVTITFTEAAGPSGSATGARPSVDDAAELNGHEPSSAPRHD